jgi:hypothetical protein
MDKNMIDLKNTTFIIPLKIDSVDRQNNLYVNLNYLNFHFKTNVIIYEQGRFIYENKIEMQEKFPNLNFKFLFDLEENNPIFHRTKYLNAMLDIVETPVVCNYDVDVIFDKGIYKKCEDLILSNQFDMIYPYGKGYFQIEVMKHVNIESFLQKPFILNILKDQKQVNENPFYIKYAEYGQAVFFNTSVYKESGGENENFISWGPEDQERYHRFKELNYKICWLSNFIYHFDHDRDLNSGRLNPYLSINDNLFEMLKKMNQNELISYYKKQEYYKKHKKIHFKHN